MHEIVLLLSLRKFSFPWKVVHFKNSRAHPKITVFQPVEDMHLLLAFLIFSNLSDSYFFKLSQSNGKSQKSSNLSCC